jgi:hypothetical protein
MSIYALHKVVISWYVIWLEMAYSTMYAYYIKQCRNIIQNWGRPSFKCIKVIYRIPNNEVQISECFLNCITTKYVELFTESMKKKTFMASCKLDFIMDHYGWREPGQRSRHSDWIRIGCLRGRRSSPGRIKNFLFSTSSRPALGSTQPPIQWVPGVKRQGREADHSTPSSAEVKKTWIYTSTPPYAFMA